MSSDPTLTPQEFCALEKISRRKLYDDWAQGRGPRYFYNGNRRRISSEARADWRREREAEVAARNGTAPEAA